MLDDSIMADIRSKVGIGGKMLNSQSREIMSNMYKFMKEKSISGTPNISHKKARVRTAEATGASIRFVPRINKELDFLRVSEDQPNKHLFDAKQK